jgi:DivIVA domain-containing protein
MQSGGVCILHDVEPDERSEPTQPSPEAPPPASAAARAASAAPPPSTNGVASQLGNVSFPVALRGYDREAVEAYVGRVVHAVSDLESKRSPEAAVRRALDRVGEETSGILQRAHEAAEEITTRSRAQADERRKAADRQSQELVQDAEARARQLDADNDALWAQRRQLIEDIRGVAAELLRVADEAIERLPPPGGRARAVAPESAGREPPAADLEMPHENGSVDQATQPMSPLDLPDGGPPEP